MKLKEQKTVSRKKNVNLPEIRTVFISSSSIETRPRTRVHPETGKSETKQYLCGSINGEAFQILCDEPVEVSEAIAVLLQPIITAQSQQNQQINHYKQNSKE